MAIMEDGSPEVKIKQEEVNGNAKGPIPRRKKPSSSNAGSHVTNILARYFFFYSPYHCADRHQVDCLVRHHRCPLPMSVVRHRTQRIVATNMQAVYQCTIPYPTLPPAVLRYLCRSIYRESTAIYRSIEPEISVARCKDCPTELQ